MHGVKRSSEVLSTKMQDAQEREEIAQYRSLIDRLLTLGRKEPKPIADIMECTNELLLINPDFITAWNIRRLALALLLPTTDMDRIREEFEFGVATIKTNPKSYGAWYHRRWLIKTLKDNDLPVDVMLELKLCDKLLQLDSRNFHCWNYRWFLTETFNVSVQAEFDFTTLMIYRNFSNYSAWHRRSLLFPRLEPIIGQQALLTAIDSDLRLIKSAYFTEPADQSCWFYLRWLLDFAGNRLGDKRDALYKQELDNISELLSIEPEAPLALVTWVHLAAQVGIPQEQIVGKLRVLERIDPLRAGMYQGIINKDYSTVM